MPSIYPAAPPTLSGDLLSISRFLQSPTMLRRRLRTYVDLRFVSDQILTNRFNSSGGAVLYEMSEPFLTARPVESVAPGQSYPESAITTGTGGLAEVTKWGQKVPLTDEEITRNVYGAQIVDRTLQKVVNSVIAQVDGVTMSAITSTVTQTQAANYAWDGSGSNPPTILRDILLGVKAITGQLLGYNPDTLLMSDLAWAVMMSDTGIQNALRRETTDNPVYTGEVDTIAGLTIVHSPHAPTAPMVLDSTQLGGMADEMAGAPGYAVSDLAVQIKSIRVDERDKWDIQGRRITVPIIQEPNAGCSITGTNV
jgi:hypothetical protein